MRKRWLINGALIILIAVCALALWLSRKPPPTPPPTVSELSPAAIHRIEIHADNHVVVLVRDARSPHWRLRRPVAARADPVHVTALLRLAGTRASRRYARAAIDAHTTGLAEPEFVVRFNDEAPITVGGQGPSAGSRYIRTAHALLLAPAPELASLTLGWSHWIDPALVPEDRRLTRIVLPRYTLTRNAAGHWQIAPAGSSRGPQDAAATAAAWRRARAQAVVPADTARQRRARITLDFANGPPRHLDVIETNPSLILRNPEIGVDYRLAGNRVAPILEARQPAAFERDTRATNGVRK